MMCELCTHGCGGDGPGDRCRERLCPTTAEGSSRVHRSMEQCAGPELLLPRPICLLALAPVDYSLADHRVALLQLSGPIGEAKHAMKARTYARRGRCKAGAGARARVAGPYAMHDLG
jgi:hypothetical protein